MSAIDDLFDKMEATPGEWVQAKAEFDQLRAENGVMIGEVNACHNELARLRVRLDKAQTENAAWEITANWYKAQLDEARKLLDDAKDFLQGVDYWADSDWEKFAFTLCKTIVVFLAGGEVCPACRGDGKALPVAGSVPCSYCKGTGKRIKAGGE